MTKCMDANGCYRLKQTNPYESAFYPFESFTFSVFSFLLQEITHYSESSGSPEN